MLVLFHEAIEAEPEQITSQTKNNQKKIFKALILK